jgi:DNA-binding NtrC family response regulator
MQTHRADDGPSAFRVLVVDDEPKVAASIEAVLSDHVEVTATTSASEALRLLERHDFHVVCTDFRMPEMTGLELLDRVSAKGKHVSCILVTGADDYFRKEDRGGYYVLLKPFEPSRLVAMVVQLARVARMRRSVEDVASARGASESRIPTRRERS